MSLCLDAAMQWAAEGVPVFPVRGKVPRTQHGVKDATTDSGQIAAWWGERPADGIGGATGAVSGYWVLDVDGDEGRASLAELEAEHGSLPATRITLTGGGGEHRWFVMPEGRKIGNRARFRPGLDVRGTGGYVVLPPSRHPSGAMYTLVDDTAPVDAPGWLLDEVAPIQAERPAVTLPLGTPGGRERGRVLGMVRAAAERIRSTPEGARNDTANRECFTIGGYLDAAGLTVDDVAPELEDATMQADQPVDLVRRSLEDGRREPRDLPIEQQPSRTVNREVTRDEPGLRLHEADPDVWPILAVRRNEDKGTETCLPTLPNAVAILDGDRRWRERVRSCEFTARLLLDGHQITDADEGEIVVWCATAYGVTFSTSTVHDAVVTVAARHPTHPVQEYLQGLQWDGVRRLSAWLVTYAGCEATPDGLSVIYGRAWMLSAVARILAPGCQVDSVLVLQEPRGGAGKTSMVRALGTLDWTSDSPIRIGDRDGAMQVQGVWIYELSELAALRRSEIESVKGFITACVDRYRPPYGRHVVERPRQVVFLGTTNDDTFLGAVDRRWWVRRVVGTADLVALRRDRDQLWAEAVHAYRAGEQWWLTDEQRRLQDDDTEHYRTSDPWEPVVAAFLEGRVGDTSIDDVIERALQIRAGDRTRAMQMRVGDVLRALGWKRTRVRDADGSRSYVYRRGQ